MIEYTTGDGNRYRYHQTDAGLVHESYDGIDQDGNETWVECPEIDPAWQTLPRWKRWWYWLIDGPRETR